MFKSPRSRRITLDSMLWVAIAFCCWFTLTRHFVAFFAVSGRWQMPAVLRVKVGHVQHDRDDTFTDVLITYRQDGAQKAYRLLKKELDGVKPEDTIWLIRPAYVTLVASPPNYRFSPIRLVTEFPEIFLLVCGSWLFARFRRRLGKPFDAYEGTEKPTVTYVVPSPDSWGRSKYFIKDRDQDENS